MYIKCFCQRTLTNKKKRAGIKTKENNGLWEGGKEEEGGTKSLDSNERFVNRMAELGERER